MTPPKIPTTPLIAPASCFVSFSTLKPQSPGPQGPARLNPIPFGVHYMAWWSLFLDGWRSPIPCTRPLPLHLYPAPLRTHGADVFGDQQSKARIPNPIKVTFAYPLPEAPVRASHVHNPRPATTARSMLNRTLGWGKERDGRCTPQRCTTHGSGRHGTPPCPHR